MRRAGHAQRGQTVVAADAVFLVDDQIAFGDFGGFGDELIGALSAARRARNALAQQILLAHQRDALGHETAFDAQHDQGYRASRLAANFYQCVFGGDILEAMLAQQVGQTLPRSPRPGGDNDAASLGGPADGLGFQLIERIRHRGPRRRGAAGGEHRSGAPPPIHARGAIRHAEGGERRTRAERQHFVPVVAV